MLFFIIILKPLYYVKKGLAVPIGNF